MKPDPAIPILLRTSARDIRVTREAQPAAVFSAGAAAARFTQNLFRRYAQTGFYGEAGWLEAHTTLLQRRTGMGAVVHYHALHLDARQNTTWQVQNINRVTPGLRLSVLQWVERPVGKAGSQATQILPSPQPVLRMQPELQTIRVLAISQPVRRSRVEQAAELITLQKKRIELNLETSPNPVAAGRVVRRADAPGADETLITRIVQQKVQEQFQEHKSAPARPGIPEAPVNINQLADQVIRQIDHRIIAQRERLGKV